MALDVKLKELIDKAKNSGYVQGVQGETDLDAAKDFCGKLLNEANNRSKGKGSPYFPLRTDAGLEDILKKSEELVRALDKLNTNEDKRTPPPPANSPWRAPAGRPPVQQQRASGNPPQVPPRGRAPAQLPQMPQGGYQTPVQQQRTQGSQPATATPTRKPRVRLGPPPRPATQGSQTQVPPIDATMNNNIGTPDNVGESIASSSPINNNKFNTMPRTQSASAGVPFENGGYPQGDINNNENEVNTNSQVASEPSKNDNDSVDSKETDTPKKSGNVVKRVFNKIFNGKKKDQEKSIDPDLEEAKKKLGELYDDIISNRQRMDNLEKIKSKEYYLDKYKSLKDTVGSLTELLNDLFFAMTGDGYSRSNILPLIDYVGKYEGEEEISKETVLKLINYVDDKFKGIYKVQDVQKGIDEENSKRGEQGKKLTHMFTEGLLLDAVSVRKTETELVKQCRDFDRLNSNVKIGPLESCENVEELFKLLKKLVDNLSSYSIGVGMGFSLGGGFEKFFEKDFTNWKSLSEEEIRVKLRNMDMILEITEKYINNLKEKEKIEDHSTLDRKTVSLKEDIIKKFNAKLQKLCDALNEKIPDKDKVSCSKARDIDKIVRQELYLLKKIENCCEKEPIIKNAVRDAIKSVSDNLNRLQEEGLTRKNYKDIVTKTNKALKDIGLIIEYLSYHDEGKRGKKIKEIIDNSVERMNILISRSGLKDDINFEKECGNDLRKLNENMENAYAQMLDYPGLGLEKSWEQISGEPGESEKVIERNLGYVADVVSAIREPKNASPEVEQPKGILGKLKSVFKKKPKNSELNETDIQTCFKAAGSYFKKAYDAAENEKNDKKKDKHFTAAGLIKNFSALKKTGWYGDFKGMLEGTKTTVKSSKDGKKGDILLCKLFISFLGLGSAENVKAACTGFMNANIEGKPKDICSVIRSKCLGGTDQGKLRTQLEKILTTGNDKTISLSKFNKIAEYFKNSSWFDNEKKSEENEPQQEQPKQDATIPVAPPLPARNAKLPPPSSPFPGNGQSGK